MSYQAAAVILLLWVLAACSGEPTDDPQLTLVLPTRFVADTPTPLPTETPESAVRADVPDKPDDLLLFWLAETGDLDPASPDVWRFEAAAGDNITLRVEGVEALLTVQASDGRVIETDREIATQIQEAGEYRVIVQTLNDDPGGAYEIGLGYSDRPNPNINLPTPVPEVVGVPTPTLAFTGLGTYISQISTDEVIGGTITEQGIPHIYTFDGLAGEFVRIEMRYVSGTIDPRLTLYGPDGRSIATDDDSGGGQNALLLNVRLPVDGLYSIQAAGGNASFEPETTPEISPEATSEATPVFSTQTPPESAPPSGGYSVQLIQYSNRAAVTPTRVDVPTPTPIPTFFVPSPAPIVDGNRLEDHDPVTAFVDSPGYVGIFPIFAAAGEPLTIGAGTVDGSAVRLRLEVSDPDGNLIARATSDDSNADGDAFISPILATLEGVYQVFVTPLTNDIGPFIIGYGSGSTWLDIPMGVPVRDDPNQGVVRRRGARDVWHLELKAGDVITLAATPADSIFDPVVEIVPADDPLTVLGVDDNGGGNRAAYLREVTIPETGQYLIRVRSAQAATVGAYALVWRYINVAPTPTPLPATYPILTVDDSVQESTYAFYTFYGTAGQSIRVVVDSREETFDPVAALIAPDGSTLAEADDSDGTLNPRIDTRLPVDGTYQVRVNGYLSGGEFDLRVVEVFD